MKVKDENSNGKKRKENHRDSVAPSRKKLSAKTYLDDEYIDENFHLLKKQTLKKRRPHRYDESPVSKFNLRY